MNRYIHFSVFEDENIRIYTEDDGRFAIRIKQSPTKGAIKESIDEFIAVKKYLAGIDLFDQSKEHEFLEFIKEIIREHGIDSAFKYKEEVIKKIDNLFPEK